MKIRSTSAAMSLLLATAFAVGTATSASAEDKAQDSWTVDGTTVSQVSLDGNLMSLEAFSEAATKADAAGGALHLVVDASAADRGYLVAFSDADAASAYMIDHGMGALPTSTREPAREAATSRAKAAASTQRMVLSPAAAMSMCSLPNHMGYLYANASCGGSALGVGWNDAVPDLRVYGWNDRAHSAALGDCIRQMTLWPNINYGGTSTSIAGYSVYTNLPLNFNGTVSSYKTTSTGVC